MGAAKHSGNKKTAAQVEGGQLKAHETPQAIVRNLVRVSTIENQYS